MHGDFLYDDDDDDDSMPTYARSVYIFLSFSLSSFFLLLWSSFILQKKRRKLSIYTAIKFFEYKVYACLCFVVEVSSLRKLFFFFFYIWENHEYEIKLWKNGTQMSCRKWLNEWIWCNRRENKEMNIELLKNQKKKLAVKELRTELWSRQAQQNIVNPKLLRKGILEYWNQFQRKVQLFFLLLLKIFSSVHFFYFSSWISIHS